MNSRLCPIAFAVLLLAGGLRAADEKDAIEADKKALAPIAGYVGNWKGTGGYRGDNAKESWGEAADWAYSFKDGHAALLFTSADGKFFRGAKLERGEKDGTFKFAGTAPAGKKAEEYVGSINKDGELVLDAVAAPGDGRPSRINISLIAKGKRLVMFYQKKGAGDRYSPLAEVGFTLQGSGFGKQTDAKECVITGGVGTISVSYKGQTYYVCCGGCKQAFEENPEKELAAYKKRKEEEKAAGK